MHSKLYWQVNKFQEFLFKKVILILQNYLFLAYLKMAENQTESFRLEQRSVIRFLMAEKYKPCEIYRKMCNMYGEDFLLKKSIYWWAKHGFALQLYDIKYSYQIQKFAHRCVVQVFLSNTNNFHTVAWFQVFLLL